MTRISHALTVAQFLDNLLDVAGDQLDRNHRRHARVVASLIESLDVILQCPKAVEALAAATVSDAREALAAAREAV